MSTDFTYALTTPNIERMLNELRQNDPAIDKAIKLVGYPQERRNQAGFEQFLRIIVGQQLSVKAAASIWGKVLKLLDEDASPSRFMAKSDEDLRSAGLSFQKINYGRCLCEAVTSGSLDPDSLHLKSDAAVVADITAIKGFGRWSAEMYLMFALGRTNVWPVGDLAVRVGVGRIIGIEERPTEKELEQIGERWHPYRSVIALLAWHYYSNAPL